MFTGSVKRHMLSLLLLTIMPERCYINNDGIFHKGNDARSIPPECCALPYTLNGAVYHKCTVNQAVSNHLGCYHSNGHWVKCQQPHGTFLGDRL